MHFPVIWSHPSELACSHLQRYAHPMPYLPRSQGISQLFPLNPAVHEHLPISISQTTYVMKYRKAVEMQQQCTIASLKKISKLKLSTCSVVACSSISASALFLAVFSIFTFRTRNVAIKPSPSISTNTVTRRWGAPAI